MKVNTSRMWRSGIAMLLALCLVVGFFPVAAFATSGGAEGTVEPKKPLYVSLGDSMTNGYGLDGYEYEYHCPNGHTSFAQCNDPWLNNQWMQWGDLFGTMVNNCMSAPECTNPNCTQPHIVYEWANGYRQAAYEGYPSLLANEYDWELTQLAMSATRVEDIRWILEFDLTDDLAKEIVTTQTWSDVLHNGKTVEEAWNEVFAAGDFYTYDKFPDGRLEAPYPYLNWAFNGAFYQTGDYVLEVIEDYQKSVAEADVISLCIGNGNFGVAMLNRLQRAFGGEDDRHLYPLETAIRTLKPEYQEEIKALSETLHAELELSVLDEETQEKAIDIVLYTIVSYIVNFDGLMDTLLKLNDDAEFILLGMIPSMNDMTLVMEDGSEFNLGKLVDSGLNFGNAFSAALIADKLDSGLYPDAKFVYAEAAEDVELLYEEFPETVYSDNATVPARFIESLYDEGDADFWNLALSVAQMLSLDTVDNMTLADVKAYKAGNTAGMSDALINTIELYIGLVDAVVGSCENGALTVGGMAAMGQLQTGSGTNEIMTAGVTAVLNEYAANGNNLSAAMTDGLLSNDLIHGAFYQYARCDLANFLGNHPTAEGHKVLFNAVDAAYAEKHTPAQETEDNLKAALEAVVEAVKKYGPEAGKAVWERWVEMGYVGEVEAYIDELIDTVEIRYDYYANEAIPAIEAAIEALEGEKDVLVAELDELNAQLAAKKAELEAVINGIEIGSIYMPEINIDPIGGNAQTEVPENNCVVDGEGVVAELEAAIRDLEHAIAVVEALIADVDADLADMIKLAEQIADAVKELNKTYESIVVAAEDLYDAFKAIEEVLTNDADQTIEAVTSAFEAARSTALAAMDVLEVAMGYARELDADILAEVDNIVELAESLYTKFINEDSLEAYIKAVTDKVLPQMTEEEQLIVAVTAAILEKIAPEVKAKLEAEIPAKIEELKAECEKEIEALIEEYKPEIEKAEKELEDKWEEIKPEIEAKYEELKAEAEAEYEAAVAALEAKRAELVAELIAAEAELKATMEELKGEAEAKVEAAVAPLKAQIARLEKDIATVNADLICATEHLDTALKLAYEEAKIAVMALYNETMAKLNAAIEALKAQLKKDIEALKAQLKGMIEEALGAMLDEVKKTVEELKNALIAMGIETVEELVDALVALFNELLYNATHADLVIDDNFKYVAMGDGSVEGYAAALKAYLAAEAAEEGINSIAFVNAAAAGNSVAAAAADLPADVADADLITLGFSQTDMLANAIVAEECDWAALVGAEAVPYVEEALAKVEAEINALDLPSEELKDMLNAIVEAYAYNVVEYAINLPQLVYAIREVNADAVIIVVGMYNPIDGVTALGNDLSAFAEYFDYLIEAADAYGIGLAMLSNAMDYVVAPEVAVEKAELSLKDLGALLEGDLSAMYPSANGDAYIAEQIENALTLSFEVGGLWGDADGDGVVTPVDAMLVLQYYVGSIDATELNVKVSDVDGDAEVSPIDAMLILQYYVGDIAKFPVEG